MVCKLMDIMPPDVWVIPLICGAGSTVIWNVRVALRFGVPPSVTRTVAVLVLPACAADGVQLNRPVNGLIIAPGGEPLSRLKVSVSAGKSASEADAVKLRVCPG